jgi:molybdate transport system substrate-binding protein
MAFLRRLLGASLLLLCSLAARADGDEPVVFAAASLQDALSAATREFAHRTGVTVVLSFAASSALARQIEGGAHADLFLSADEGWMDYLQARGLIVPDTRLTVLANRLVLIAPPGSTATLSIRRGMDLEPLLAGRALALAAPDSVPAGRYARAALQRLGVWEGVAPRISVAADVRAALAQVEHGEAPLGIVYATDARAAGAVHVVGEFPADSHPPIRYPMARVRSGQSPHAAALLAFLASQDVHALFEDYGFLHL